MYHDALEAEHRCLICGRADRGDFVPLDEPPNLRAMSRVDAGHKAAAKNLRRRMAQSIAAGSPSYTLDA